MLLIWSGLNSGRLLSRYALALKASFMTRCSAGHMRVLGADAGGTPTKANATSLIQQWKQFCARIMTRRVEERSPERAGRIAASRAPGSRSRARSAAAAIPTTSADLARGWFARAMKNGHLAAVVITPGLAVEHTLFRTCAGDCRAQ